MLYTSFFHFTSPCWQCLLQLLEFLNNYLIWSKSLSAHTSPSLTVTLICNIVHCKQSTREVIQLIWYEQKLLIHAILWSSGLKFYHHFLFQWLHIKSKALVWGQLLLQTPHEGHFPALTTEPCKMDDMGKAHITNLSHVKMIFSFNNELPPAWHQHSENKKISQALWEQNFYI